jgi:hypothetical protein
MGQMVRPGDRIVGALANVCGAPGRECPCGVPAYSVCADAQTIRPRDVNLEPSGPRDTPALALLDGPFVHGGLDGFFHHRGRVRPEAGTATLETVMSSASTPKHRPHQPIHDVPDELVPGSMPVEPDEGPVPATIPDDPEDDRVIDPEP